MDGLCFKVRVVQNLGIGSEWETELKYLASRKAQKLWARFISVLLLVDTGQYLPNPYRNITILIRNNTDSYELKPILNDWLLAYLVDEHDYDSVDQYLGHITSGNQILQLVSNKCTIFQNTTFQSTWIHAFLNTLRVIWVFPKDIDTLHNRFTCHRPKHSSFRNHAMAILRMLVKR